MQVSNREQEKNLQYNGHQKKNQIEREFHKEMPTDCKKWMAKRNTNGRIQAVDSDLSAGDKRW